MMKVWTPVTARALLETLTRGKGSSRFYVHMDLDEAHYRGRAEAFESAIEKLVQLQKGRV